ncbi:hypothetical protein ACWEVD_01130 [Nocardia thailandica]
MNRPTHERIIMREVIPPAGWADTASPELVLTMLDPTDLVPAGPGVLVWSPDLPSMSTCSWDVLATIATAADADAICEHLFATVVDYDAVFYVPEASLLTANLLLAARRGGLGLAEVVGWVRSAQLAPASRLLDDTGERGALADLEAFAASSAAEQSAIWSVIRSVVLPLGTAAALRALTSVHPTVLTEGAGAWAELSELVIVIDPRSPRLGAANALRAQLRTSAARARRGVRLLAGGAR